MKSKIKDLLFISWTNFLYFENIQVHSQCFHLNFYLVLINMTSQKYVFFIGMHYGMKLLGSKILNFPLESPS